MKLQRSEAWRFSVVMYSERSKVHCDDRVWATSWGFEVMKSTPMSNGPQPHYCIEVRSSRRSSFLQRSRITNRSGLVCLFGQWRGRAFKLREKGHLCRDIAQCKTPLTPCVLSLRICSFFTPIICRASWSAKFPHLVFQLVILERCGEDDLWGILRVCVQLTELDRRLLELSPWF